MCPLTEDVRPGDGLRHVFARQAAEPGKTGAEQRLRRQLRGSPRAAWDKQGG